MTSVADLLATARAQHVLYRQQAGSVDRYGVPVNHGDSVLAAAAVQAALDARVAAQDADPERADAAWAEDLKLNRGVTNAALVSFYRNYLHV